MTTAHPELLKRINDALRSASCASYARSICGINMHPLHKEKRNALIALLWGSGGYRRPMKQKWAPMYSATKTSQVTMPQHIQNP